MKNLILTLTAAVVMTTAVFAQPGNFKKNDYANLTIAIKSDNDGLRRSGIYLAGKYQMKELSGELIGQLKKEDDASTKILIALALYRIGTDEGIAAIENLSKTDRNKEVKRMAAAIVEQAEKDNQVTLEASIR